MDVEKKEKKKKAKATGDRDRILYSQFLLPNTRGVVGMSTLIGA